MIELIKEGKYELIETKGEVKILTLDSKNSYAWKNIADIGEILITSHSTHKVDHILCIGTYRLYHVENEPNYSDQIHIELLVGKATWQGYLLPTGLPTNEKIRSRIIPTNEVISRCYSLTL